MTEATEDKTAEETFTALTGEEAPAKHTILKVWKEILSNVDKSAAEKVSMDMALRLLRSYPFLTMAHTHEVHQELHEILAEARNILDVVLEQHPKAIDQVEDDGQSNREAYLNIVLLWQQMLQERQREWDPRNDFAEAEAAGYVEAFSMLVGQNGLLPQLDSIDFQPKEEELTAIQDALNEGVV